MMNTKENKTLEYYLGLDYPITIYKAEEGGYVAEVEDLPGCITEGETIEEVLQRIEAARYAWIEVAYEDGMEIPIPRTEHEYSGKFIVRVPRSLHRRLAELAMREGVSLNQQIEVILSDGVSAATHSNKIDELISEIKRLANQVASRKQTMIPVPTSYYKWEFEPLEPTPSINEYAESGFVSESVLESEGVIAA